MDHAELQSAHFLEDFLDLFKRERKHELGGGAEREGEADPRRAGSLMWGLIPGP